MAAGETLAATELSNLGLLHSGPEEAAETLLFLHGWGGAKELWQEPLRLLGGSFRCLAPDLPGTGGTPLPPEMTTIPRMAAWVAETCARLGLERVTLVGHSLGGNLAAQAALDYPGLVHRLVLVDAALDPTSFPIRARWPLHGRWGLPILRLMRWGAAPLAWWASALPPPGPRGFWPDQARRAYWYRQANPDDSVLQMQLQALTDNPLLPARLTHLPLPILILHGARDPVVSLDSVHALAEALPLARLEVFPTALHCPMDTDPKGFTRAITDFVQDHCLDAPARACYNERRTPDPT